jgi:hypothetical protein
VKNRTGADQDWIRIGHAPWRIKGRHIGAGGERMRGMHLGDVGRACVVTREYSK